MLIILCFIIISMSTPVTVDRIEGDLAVIEAQHNDRVIMLDVPDKGYQEGQRLHMFLF